MFGAGCGCGRDRERVRARPTHGEISAALARSAYGFRCASLESLDRCRRSCRKVSPRRVRDLPSTLGAVERAADMLLSFSIAVESSLVEASRRLELASVRWRTEPCRCAVRARQSSAPATRGARSVKLAWMPTGEGLRADRPSALARTRCRNRRTRTAPRARRRAPGHRRYTRRSARSLLARSRLAR